MRPYNQRQIVPEEETLLPFAWIRRGPMKYKLLPKAFLNNDEISKDQFTIANLKEIVIYKVHPGNRYGADVIRALRRAATSRKSTASVIARMVAANLASNLTKCLEEGRKPEESEVVLDASGTEGPRYTYRVIGTLDERHHVTLQYEAALLLGVLACGSMAQSGALVYGGALHMLIRLLDSPHAPKHVILWALGGIAMDGYASYLMKANVHLMLLETLLTTQDLALLTTATYCLSQLCAHFRTLEDKLRVYGTLRLLVDQRQVLLEQRRRLKLDNRSVLKHTCKALHAYFQADRNTDTEDVSRSLMALIIDGDDFAFVLEPLVLIACKFKHYDILSGFIVSTIEMFFRTWDVLDFPEREFVYFAIIEVLRYGAKHIQILIDAGIFSSLAQILRDEVHVLLKESVARTLDKALRYPRWVEDDRQLKVIEASGLVDSLTSIFVSIEDSMEK